MISREWKTVFLGLGSNLGKKRENLLQAARMLQTPDLRVRQASSIYRTSPMDYLDQDWFLNQVLEVETCLPPPALLNHCLECEKRLGRIRLNDKGPRIIDIDVLFYDREIIEAPTLAIPHPRIAKRKFVLTPLAEIAPDWIHPVLRKSMQDLLLLLGDDPAIVEKA